MPAALPVEEIIMDQDNDRLFTTARIRTKVPFDESERAKFTAALEAVAAIYPVDGVEPLRGDVLHEATVQLFSEDLARFDPSDGSDWADTLVEAYFAARSDYAARSISSGGNA